MDGFVVRVDQLEKHVHVSLVEYLKNNHPGGMLGHLVVMAARDIITGVSRTQRLMPNISRCSLLLLNGMYRFVVAYEGEECGAAPDYMRLGCRGLGDVLVEMCYGRIMSPTIPQLTLFANLSALIRRKLASSPEKLMHTLPSSFEYVCDRKLLSVDLKMEKRLRRVLRMAFYMAREGSMFGHGQKSVSSHLLRDIVNLFNAGARDSLLTDITNL